MFSMNDVIRLRDYTLCKQINIIEHDSTNGKAQKRNVLDFYLDLQPSHLGHKTHLWRKPLKLHLLDAVTLKEKEQ